MAVEERPQTPTRSGVASQPLIAPVLLAVWGGGTSVYLITLILAPPPQSGLTADWLIVACGYSMFAGFVLYRRQLTLWAIDLNGYVGVFCASVVVAASADSSTPYALFYLWVTVQSCHFLPRRRAIPQLVLVSIGYLMALRVAGGPFPWTRWVLLSATVAVVGFSVAFLRRRAEELLETLAAQARTDPLTKLLNRRAFEERLDAEISRAGRTRQPLALIMADLDHFKVINDRWGHPVGDDVLRRVSDILRQQCRQMDDAFRVGGEEFAVIVPDADVNVAAVLAERIRCAVRTNVDCAGDVITLSLGIATYPKPSEDAAALVAAADANCYQAKHEGRDRTMIMGDDGIPRQRTAERRDSSTRTQSERLPPPDRDRFRQCLDQALARGRQSGQTTAILCVDVDDLTLIVDRFGPQIGDQLLAAIAQRLLGLLRPGDTVARIGRDEFVILCENVDDSLWLYSLAPGINSAMTESFVFSGLSIHSAVNVGMAVADTYDSRPMSADALMREADAATYRAKCAARAAHLPFGRAGMARN